MPEVVGRSHRVVIVGGGFAGLATARALRSVNVNVTMIDRRNHHLFQPLLYQVATGGLSPGDVSAPLRGVLTSRGNADVLHAEVVDVDLDERAVILADEERIPYDTLIVAAGLRTHYFGNEEWAKRAPGLKSVEDALSIRRRILTALETAERIRDADERRPWLRFVIVGAGPTGVELAGAIAELTGETVRDHFRRFDPRDSEIILLEGLSRVLPPYPEDLSAAARDRLEKMGVDVRTETMVQALGDGWVDVQRDGDEDTERIEARTTLWAAGMRASTLGDVLAERSGADRARSGRIRVNADLSVPTAPDILVVGDLAYLEDRDGEALPALAPVAMQQGKHAARVVSARLAGTTSPPFRYRDRGTMAVIGRNAAVADLGRVHMRGPIAFVLWVFIHIAYLIGFDNKIRVLIQWGWMYVTRKRGALLITDPESLGGTSDERGGGRS